MSLDFPNRPLIPQSSFYIKRPPLEEMAKEQITKPGGFLRIQGSQKMGKSSFVNQLMDYAQNQGYKTVYIDLQQADSEIFSDLDKFLRWFCVNVGHALKLPSLLKNYWDKEIGSKVNCTFYFEEYLLASLNSPVVLVINEVNHLFDYPKIAQDFLPMLRSWYEQALQIEPLQKLRLVLVHSTEIYLNLPIHQSPFNIGLPLNLPEFSLEQVKKLALVYGLDSQKISQTPKIMALIGGHPYLVNLAFYHIMLRSITIEKLLTTTASQEIIYGDYLSNIWVKLREDSEILAAFDKVLKAPEKIELPPRITYKLDSLGLINILHNEATIKNKLYRLYFTSKNEHLPKISLSLVKILKEENKNLKALLNLDELTKIANRRYFNEYLKTQWEKMLEEKKPLSLILIDIDCFKQYNDTYGHQEGDLCLKQVARAIASCFHQPKDVVARYGGEEFGVILPSTDGKAAVAIAEKINRTISKLEIEHINSVVTLKKVTVSLGVASIIPRFGHNTELLFCAADKALYDSKKHGRNRVTLSPFFNLHLTLIQKQE